jgi:hypothetical protein
MLLLPVAVAVVWSVGVRRVVVVPADTGQMLRVSPLVVGYLRRGY